MVLFESGHPDLNTPPIAGLKERDIGALGALDKIRHSLGLGVEIPDLKLTEMIKSIAINDKGKKAYVEYYEYFATTNKWFRRRESRGANKEKDPVKRQLLLQALALEIQTTIYNRCKVQASAEGELLTLIQNYITDKTPSLKKTSIKNIKGSLNYFYGWMKHVGLEKIPVQEINKQHIYQFRAYMANHTSGRSVNNHISFVSSFFNYLIDPMEMVLTNPCHKLAKLPQSSETHVAYTDDQTKKLFAYMAENEPNLLLFCKFIGMGFVRCEEARNLKVGDIDFNKRSITVTAGIGKTRKRIVKPLLEVFYTELIKSKIHLYPSDNYIFTYKQKPGEKPVHYNHFQKKFKKIKTKFKISNKYTIYGFRHTFVSQLLDNGAKWHEVMKYTGHTTMDGFSKYARSLGLKPAQDLSHLLNFS